MNKKNSFPLPCRNAMITRSIAFAYMCERVDESLIVSVSLFLENYEPYKLRNVLT